MSKQTMSIVVVICLALLVIFAKGCRVDINDYSGDGTIEKTGKWPFSRGYSIHFDKVLLNKNYYNKFRLENIPNIGKTYDFCIKVRATKKSLEELKNGELQMRVFSENGYMYFDIKEPLGNWTFSRSYLGQGTFESLIFFFSDQGESLVPPEKLESKGNIYFVVGLEGVGKNPSVVGEILLRVGGYK